LGGEALTLELITVGYILKETIKYPDRVIGPVLGSPAAYTSVTAARLGTKTGIVTKVGSEMPEQLLRVFWEAGVDLTGMNREDKTTINFLIYDESGRKTIKYIQKSSLFSFKDFPRKYLDAEIIHICPMDFEVPEETLKELRQHVKILSVDLGGYGGATSSIHPATDKKAKMIFESIIGYFDIIRASNEDCSLIFGRKRKVELTALNYFINAGAKIAIITLGRRGCIISHEGRHYHVPALSTKVVDVTGAGDSFSAGFLSEYIRTGDPLTSAIFGNAVASIIVSRSGGITIQRIPTRSCVEERLRNVLEEIQIREIDLSKS